MRKFKRVPRGAVGARWTARQLFRCSGTFGVRPCRLCAVSFRCHVPSWWAGFQCLRTDTDHEHGDQACTTGPGGTQHCHPVSLAPASPPAPLARRSLLDHGLSIAPCRPLAPHTLSRRSRCRPWPRHPPSLQQSPSALSVTTAPSLSLAAPLPAPCPPRCQSHRRRLRRRPCRPPRPTPRTRSRGGKDVGQHFRVPAARTS